MAWLFPFEKIEKNSTIVLYGAGSVGYEFYCQLTHSGYCKEIIWVDSQYEDGRQTVMTDRELEEKIAELAPGLYRR